MKIERLPSGNYRARVYLGIVDGKKKFKSFTHPDKITCERLASEYADTHRVYESGTFGEAMDALLAQKKPVLSPETYRGYISVKNKLESDYSAFCGLIVADIDRDVLQKLVNDMTMFASPKTIRNRCGFISSVIKSKGYMMPIVTLPERKKADLHIPDVKDVQKLIKASKDTEVEIPILLAAFAPLRRGEIVALRMEDIEGDTIHVRRSIAMDETGKLMEKTPKTYESNRDIVMPKYIMDKIRKKGYICKYDRPNSLTRAFKKVANECGLGDVRLHDLRHFCASWLHAQNIPEEYILSRGGWATANVMKTVYRHALSSEENKVTKRILFSMGENFFE